MPIYQIARYKVRKESVDKIVAACARIRRLHPHQRTRHPGILFTARHQRPGLASSITSSSPTGLPAIFTAIQARANHLNRILFPETLAPVEFSEWSLVAKK